MDECIDLLGDARVFSALDANCSYWQEEMERADNDKTERTLHNGFYQSSCQPFGLPNAPGTIQWTMDVISSPLKWQFALVYLDYIIIFSRTPDNHTEQCFTTLSLLHRTRVTSNLKRWKFFMEKIVYFGTWDTTQSKEACFSHHGPNMRHKTSSSNSEMEVNFRFMRCILTLWSQFCAYFHTT